MCPYLSAIQGGKYGDISYEPDPTVIAVFLQLRPLPVEQVLQVFVELDFISHPDAKDIKAARQDPSLVYHSTPGWTWDYQQFNLLNEEFPYQNTLVREAISYAIDREAIRDEIYYGEATVTDNQISRRKSAASMAANMTR